MIRPGFWSSTSHHQFNIYIYIPSFLFLLHLLSFFQLWEEKQSTFDSENSFAHGVYTYSSSDLVFFDSLTRTRSSSCTKSPSLDQSTETIFKHIRYFNVRFTSTQQWRSSNSSDGVISFSICHSFFLSL